ncbi:winged helix-turn-helix domain-containing protein [Nonomuraea sp. NPDC049269]|uniref:winged helix-turn-helix domain-containing protein n=1 Tax=Nonomuraea sp. NPDC049269 TaxID=3364349 RepID=UPI003718F418
MSKEKLSARQWARLEAELRRGPLAWGYVEDQCWTLGRVKTLIGRLFHIGYTTEGVGKLLHGHGWSVPVPVRRAMERDEEAIAAWKAEHLASWARFAPGVKQSAGRKKGHSATGHGNPYLARILGETAVIAGRTNTFLGERYGRIARRRGEKRAIVAVGRSILTIIWHLPGCGECVFFFDNHAVLPSSDTLARLVAEARRHGVSSRWVSNETRRVRMGSCAFFKLRGVSGFVWISCTHDSTSKQREAKQSVYFDFSSSGERWALKRHCWADDFGILLKLSSHRSRAT